jgi:hypothetical protein
LESRYHSVKRGSVKSKKVSNLNAGCDCSS